MAALSKRSAETLAALDKPWKFAAATTYDPDTNPQGLISFATAENALSVKDITDFANANITFEPVQFGYKFGNAGGARFASALAVHLNEYLHPHHSIKPEYIKATDSCTALHDILSWAIADEGEGILLSRPVYGRFELDFPNRSKVKVVYADTDAENCFDEDVVDKYERALVQSNSSGVKIRAILIVNPNNPLGKCYPRGTIIKLMELCQKHRIHLISDEVYACSVFESDEPGTVPFTSALSIDSRGIIDEDLLHIEYGFAKDFASGGMRVGAIVTKNQGFHQAISSIVRFHHPSGPSIAIACGLLEDRPWCRSYISSMQKKLAAAHRHVTKGLRDIGIEYLLGSNAGFFVWINLSPYLPKDLDHEENAEFALAKKLQEAGVFLHPKEEHSNRPGWFRLVYTHDPRTVTEGLKRIAKVTSQKEWPETEVHISY